MCILIFLLLFGKLIFLLDTAIAETQKEAKNAYQDSQEPERKPNVMEKMGNKVQDKLNFLPF